MNKKLSLIIISILTLSLLLCACNNASTETDNGFDETSISTTDHSDTSTSGGENRSHEYAVVSSEGIGENFLNSFSAAPAIGLYTSTYEKQFDNVDTSKVSPFTSES